MTTLTLLVLVIHTLVGSCNLNFNKVLYCMCLISACNCDPEGSHDMQCDDYGNCPCIDGVEGKRCDRCMENHYNITAGCIGKA